MTHPPMGPATPTPPPGPRAPSNAELLDLIDHQLIRQDQVEAELIASWAAAETEKGRDARELIWGTCVREAGVLDGEDVAE